MHVSYAVEGVTDEPVAERLIREVGMEPVLKLSARGKTNLDSKLSGFNRAAHWSPWLVLRDLDNDDKDKCLPALAQSLLSGPPSTGMCLRIAVRETEAWLLADKSGCEDFFDVDGAAVPRFVELLPDPKRSLVEMCRHSGKREIRDGMVPRSSSGRIVGDRYTVLLRGFVEQSWDPERARLAAPSLDRAIRALERLRSVL